MLGDGVHRKWIWQGQSLRYQILLKSFLHSQSHFLKKQLRDSYLSWHLQMCLAKKFTVAGQTIPYAIDNVHNTVALWKQTTLTVNEN